jgi:hypothetical protein
MRRASTVYVPAGTLAILYWPASSVVARNRVPLTETCALESGRELAESVIVPAMRPVPCASIGTSGMLRSDETAIASLTK